MRSEWILCVRSRGLGGVMSVHYGTQQEIDWFARAAAGRGDEIVEHRGRTEPEGDTGAERAARE